MPLTITNTSTLNTMLPEYARQIGAYVGSFSTSTNISNDTSIVIASLADRGWNIDDILNDFYVRIKGITNDGVIRRVTDYAGSTGTITVSGSALAIESQSVDVELYRYDPQRLIDTLSDGAQAVFPNVYVPVYNNVTTTSDDQRIYTRPTSIPRGYVRQVLLEERIDAKTHSSNIVNDLNCDFEASTLTDWTGSNATIVIESETNDPDNAMVWASQQSAKVTVNAGAVGQLYLSVTSPTSYEGEEIHFAIWCYSMTASRVSAMIQIDSGTVVTGSSHTGNGWERLTASTVANGVSTSIKVGIQISSGSVFTCYVDEALAVAGREGLPRAGRIPIRNWFEQDDNIYILEGVKADRNLLIVGMGMLDFDALSGTGLEINQNTRRMVYNYAAMQLFQGEIDTLDAVDQQQALNRYNHFKNRANESVGRMAPMAMLRNTASY